MLYIVAAETTAILARADCRLTSTLSCEHSTTNAAKPLPKVLVSGSVLVDGNGQHNIPSGATDRVRR